MSIIELASHFCIFSFFYPIPDPATALSESSVGYRPPLGNRSESSHFSTSR